jgi:site-specific DNA-methyltransferase (cytosine-N4-specific)
MSQQELICKMKPYIQPFERQLALMELSAVSEASPLAEPGLLEVPIVYRVTTSISLEHLANTLAYWETVTSATSVNVRYTRQVRREATVNIARNGVTPERLRTLLPFGGSAVPVPNRRVLRYGTHGVHEYRGKFFPQLVRAVLNIAGVKPGDIVLDPMCGSGTTLVEASLLGCTSVGLDINPLSVLMSSVKCAMLRTSPDVLAAEYESLRSDALNMRQHGDAVPWLERLPEKDHDYLRSWFSPRVLVDLDPIAVRVHATRNVACRGLFRLCLSNILRHVSWQKDADLRVRKEIHPDVNGDVVTEFVREIDRSVRIVLAFLYENNASQPGLAQIIEGDARSLAAASVPTGQSHRKIKAVVTSPPYATALPYLDTDRLSLCYLGLLSRPEHRIRQYEMIGNREVTKTRHRDYWQEYQQRREELPKDVAAVIDRIHQLNSSARVGFRRRNLAALLARYFLDMCQVFQNIAAVLEPGGYVYVVIGNNHTIAGGQRVNIETDQLMSLLGQLIGFTLEYTIPMEMLASRDIFKKNAIASESILCFRK